MAAKNPRDLQYFIECLQHKYLDIDEYSNNFGVEVVVNKKISLQEVRVVSFQEYRNLKYANREGVENDIETNTPNIQELNLAKTKIEDWNVVLSICSQLKRLSELNLDRLKIKNESLASDHVFGDVEILSISKMLNTSERYMAIANTFPNLITLVIKQSKLKDIAFLPESNFSSILRLNLAYNELTQWEQILPASKLPNLELLSLVGNKVSQITKPESTEGEPYFRTLRVLNLEETSIDNWTSLSNLSAIPLLEDVRVTKTPLAMRYGDDTRKFTIALNPGLKIVNGGKVDADERKSSERAFVREFRDAEDCSKLQTIAESKLSEKAYLASMTEEDIETLGPHYTRLVGKVGEVFRFAEVDMTAPVDVLLHFEAYDGRVESHRIGLNLAVGELRDFCESMFGIPRDEIRLWFGAIGTVFKEMKLDTRKLHSFKMSDDDTVLVNVRADL